MSADTPQATDPPQMKEDPDTPQPDSHATSSPRSSKRKPKHRLPPRVRAELAELWSHKKMVPTVTSRQKWSEIRGVPVTKVNHWFSSKKFYEKKLGKPVSEETYDLDLDIPDYILKEESDVTLGVKRETTSSPSPSPHRKRVKIGRNDLENTTRLGDRHTPAPGSDDTLVASSPPAYHSTALTQKKRAYSQVSEISPISPIAKSQTELAKNHQTSHTLPLDTDTSSASRSELDTVLNLAPKFVYPPDDLLLPFTPDSNQELCIQGIHSESNAGSNFVCSLCSFNVSDYSEIPGSTNLDSLAYMRSSVDPNTKEMTSDYKALSTPVPTFGSIAFEYQLPAEHSPYPELESNADSQDLDLNFEDQIALSLPRNDTDEVDLSWVDSWKEDRVFMLVEDEEVESGKGIVKLEGDQGESGELDADGEEDVESDAESDFEGWLPEQREWVSVTLTL